MTLTDEDGLCEALANAGGNAAVLILTHDHDLDFRLARDGLPAETADRTVCPIGMPGIDGKEPAVIPAAIAVAVAAQVLALPRA